MARRPLPNRNRPRFYTLSATREFISANDGRRGLFVHVAAADDLASASEMVKLLHDRHGRAGMGWHIGNLNLLKAAAKLYHQLMEAVALIDKLAGAVRGRLTGDKVLDDDDAALLRQIREAIHSTTCRPASKGAKTAANRLHKVSKALKWFDKWFVTWRGAFEAWRRRYDAASRLRVVWNLRPSWLRALKQQRVKVLHRIKGLRRVMRELVAQPIAFPF